MFKFELREERSIFYTLFTSMLVVLVTCTLLGFLFLILDRDPFILLRAYFIDPIATPFGLAEWAVKSSPLIIIGLGLSLGFRAGVWNIGAEGQLLIGAIAGSSLPLLLYPFDSWVLVPGGLLLGILGGAAWAAIPAFLRVQFRVNEILTSLMLTYVAAALLNYTLQGPLKDPDGFNFPQSRIFQDGAIIPTIFDGFRVHWGFVLALILVCVAWFFHARHVVGFQFRVFGFSRAAAHYAGIAEKRIIWTSFLVSGGLAGLAGFIEASAVLEQLVPNISPAYGFTAIIVAFLGRLHPVGVVIAGAVIGLSYLGGENTQLFHRLPSPVTGIFQGTLLLTLVAMETLSRYRLVRVLPEALNEKNGNPRS